MPYHPAKTDGFIDNLITIALDEDNWVDRGSNVAPLAAHCMFRPLHPEDDLPWDESISIRKLEGEGTLDKDKICLGWEIRTRQFCIYLPIEKAQEWIHDINSILEVKIVSSKTLEKTIGRLNHAGYIIPQGWYFLNQLRQTLTKSKQFGPQGIHKRKIDDLQLWKQLLEKVSKVGIDINNITFTSPTDVVHSDACKTGMGGFDENRFAWRFQLPSDL